MISPETLKFSRKFQGSFHIIVPVKESRIYNFIKERDTDYEEKADNRSDNCDVNDHGNDNIRNR